MIWTERTYTFGSIEYNFGDGVWRAERSLLIFRGSPNTEFNVTVGAVTLRSITDGTGNVMLDISDILASYAIGASGSIAFNTGESTPTERIGFEIKGDLSPASMIIPNNGKISEYAPIIAPVCFFQGLWGLSTQFVLHTSPSVSWALQFTEYIDGSPTTTTFQPDTLQAVVIAGNRLVFRVREGIRTLAVRDVNIREPQCGRCYAMVQWVSACGIIKRHTFEVRDVELSVSDSVSLQNNFGGFREAKGTRKGLRLHLPQLTAYDYWYYSDIITSSDVRVAVSEIDADFGEDTRVKVTTKSATIPNGASVADFDVDVILKDYDII